jgi:hypothetical protein
MSEVYSDIHSRLEGRNDPDTFFRENTSGSVFIVKDLVFFISTLVISLLTLRLIFIIFGTNSGNDFVDFIYTASHPLVVPFMGVFDHRPVFGAVNFDPESLTESSIAIIVYSFIVWFLNRLLSIFYFFDTKKPKLYQ